MRSTTWSSLTRLATTTRKRLLPSSETAFTNPILDMLAHNWSIALTAFGGPAVHFQIFRRVFVDEYKWIDETTYTEMFALCQALSGPASTKMIYHINVIHYGFWTGFLSFFVWSLPTALAGFGLAMGVGQVGEQLPPLAYALLSGLNSATVGIVALAAVQLSNKAATDTLTSILVFLGATAGMLYNALWYFPVLMMLGALAAVVWDLRLMQRGWKMLRCGSQQQQDVRREEGPEPVQMRDLSHLTATSASGNDSGSSANAGSTSHGPQAQIPESTFRTKQSLLSSWQFGAAIIAAFFASFIIVMVCRGLYSGTNRGFDLFANLYLAGTIIFGGGPVVIPLLREYVVAPGWVSWAKLQLRSLPGSVSSARHRHPYICRRNHRLPGYLLAWDLVVYWVYRSVGESPQDPGCQGCSAWSARCGRRLGFHRCLPIVRDRISG
jgi:chromate transport protein ChrA